MAKKTSSMLVHCIFETILPQTFGANPIISLVRTTSTWLQQPYEIFTDIPGSSWRRPGVIREPAAKIQETATSQQHQRGMWRIGRSQQGNAEFICAQLSKQGKKRLKPNPGKTKRFSLAAGLCPPYKGYPLICITKLPLFFYPSQNFILK